MKLKNLNLLSFGKFKDKRINFKNGLNIIYGENESGKTTIHNFIDGMFYGFLRPYVTRRYYREEYEKYRPWEREAYKGIIHFSKDDIEYRIERDFGREQVRVYEDLTGKDITKTIDTGEKVKVHLPGVHFFNFNTMVYNNTVSIKQLGNRIDSDLSTEVKDRLANISTSLDDDISVKTAITQLEKRLESIGTENAYTRPHGKAKVELDKLKEKHKNILQEQERYNRYIDEFGILKKQIEKKRFKNQQLKNKLEKAEIFQAKRIYTEALVIKKKIKNINEEVKSLEDYSKLSFDEYTEALNINKDKDYIGIEIENLFNRMNKIEAEIKNTAFKMDEGIVKGIKIEELYEDVGFYNEIDDEKNQILINSQINRLEILDSQLKDTNEKYNRYRIQRIISIIMSIGFLGLGLLNPFVILFAIPLAVVSFFVGKKKKQYNGDIEKLREEIKKNQLEEDKKNDKIQKIDKYQEDIKIKYKCSSKTELNRLYDEIHIHYINRKNEKEMVQILKKDMEDVQVDLKDKKGKQDKLIEKIKTLMEKNNSETLDEFKKGLEKKKSYDNLIKDKDNKREILSNLLKDITLEQLESKLVAYDEKYFEHEEYVDKSSIIDKVEQGENDLSILKNKFTRLEERIDNLNEKVKERVNIEEEINRYEYLIQDFEDKIKAINIAKGTIEKISEQIHEQFAPAINKKVSKVINRITDGRYNQIRIDDQLDIAIENPNTKGIIDIDDLSGGTIDQLYFALRFSIINSIEESNLPLILDDCFIQYDDERLKNILRFLDEIGSEKQILLFTCHHREKKVLEELGLVYNLIEIA